MVPLVHTQASTFPRPASHPVQEPVWTHAQAEASPPHGAPEPPRDAQRAALCRWEDDGGAWQLRRDSVFRLPPG